MSGRQKSQFKQPSFLHLLILTIHGHSSGIELWTGICTHSYSGSLSFIFIYLCGVVWSTSYNLLYLRVIGSGNHILLFSLKEVNKSTDAFAKCAKSVKSKETNCSAAKWPLFILMHQFMNMQHFSGLPSWRMVQCNLCSLKHFSLALRAFEQLLSGLPLQYFYVISLSS